MSDEFQTISFDADGNLTVKPGLAGNLIGCLTPVCMKAGMSIGDCSKLAADIIRSLRAGGYQIVGLPGTVPMERRSK
jgi:hypothetical protein